MTNPPPQPPTEATNSPQGNLRTIPISNPPPKHQIEYIFHKSCIDQHEVQNEGPAATSTVLVAGWLPTVWSVHIPKLFGVGT